MLGLGGLAQAALAALPPNGTAPPTSLRAGTIEFIRQEPPWHPLPRFLAGVQGPNVAAPPQVRSSLLTQQEPPWHPTGRFWIGIQGPNVRPPIVDAMWLRHEMPWHPIGKYWAGQQQAGNVGLTPEIIPRVYVVQEQPWHPRSYLWSAPPPTPRSQVKYQFIGTQAQPWHPSSVFFAGLFPIDYEEVQVLIIL